MSVVHCSLSMDGVLRPLTQCGIILSIYVCVGGYFQKKEYLKSCHFK